MNMMNSSREMRGISRIRRPGRRRHHGAAFPEKFVGDTPWVHLDIAGPAWLEKENPISPEAPRESASVCCSISCGAGIEKRVMRQRW